MSNQQHIKSQIRDLADRYSMDLMSKIDDRNKEMKDDDNSHYLLYQILGVSPERGKQIDELQNVGRYLYKYAGAFMEEAAVKVLKERFPNGKKVKTPNTKGGKPKSFEIDFLNDQDAIELKWKDATTDGDHITKEHTRVKVIKEAGYKPIRIMFFSPQRSRAIRIQETLRTLYRGLDGAYYAGDEAWEFMFNYTGIDFKQILMEIAADHKLKSDKQLEI